MRIEALTAVCALIILRPTITPTMSFRIVNAWNKCLVNKGFQTSNWVSLVQMLKSKLRI